MWLGIPRTDQTLGTRYRVIWIGAGHRGHRRAGGRAARLPAVALATPAGRSRRAGGGGAGGIVCARLD